MSEPGSREAEAYWLSVAEVLVTRGASNFLPALVQAAGDDLSQEAKRLMFVVAGFVPASDHRAARPEETDRSRLLAFPSGVLLAGEPAKKPKRRTPRRKRTPKAAGGVP